MSGAMILAFVVVIAFLVAAILMVIHFVRNGIDGIETPMESAQRIKRSLQRSNDMVRKAHDVARK